MSGSKGSPHPRSGHSAPNWPPESEEQARAIEYERWLHEQRQLAQQQVPPQPPFGYGGQDPAGYPSQPVYPGQHASGNGAYQPQFERFEPQQQHREPYPHQPEPPPPVYPGHYGHEPQHTHHDPAQFGAQRLDYGHPAPPAARAHQVDPQSWDLSHYQPSQIPVGYQDPYARGGEPPQQQGWPQAGAAHEAEQRHAQQAHWQQGQQHVDAYGRPMAYQDEGGHGGYPGQQGHYDQAGQLPAADTDYDADSEPVDEPRRGPSTLMIVGALVGAIAIGGGLAVAYKQFTAGKGGAKVAQVTRPAEPTKERPQNPGGKTFDHTDKTFQNRLSTDGQTAQARTSDVDGGAKKVPTIPITINRDGTLTPQPLSAPPPQASSGVPGLVIDGPPPLRGGPGGTAFAPPPPPPAARQAPPAAPRVADLPLPKVISKAPPPPTEEVADVEPPRAAVPKKRVAAVRDDLVAQQAGAASTSAAASAVGAPSGLGSVPKSPATKAAAGGSGFVAVLASKKTRQDALNSFADMHSQYPDLLTGMTPDVREANLADKGVWYRLIVGPPGSREAAKSLCAKLKERGMKDCWPVAY